VPPARADLGERPRRRRGLARPVIPPASDRAIGLHPAGVQPARADLGEGSGGGRGLAVIVIPPAGDDPVGLHPAGLIRARADLAVARRPRGRKDGLHLLLITH